MDVVVVNISSLTKMKVRTICTLFTKFILGVVITARDDCIVVDVTGVIIIITLCLILFVHSCCTVIAHRTFLTS